MTKPYSVHLMLAALLVACGAGQITDDGIGANGGSGASPQSGGAASDGGDGTVLGNAGSGNLPGSGGTSANGQGGQSNDAANGGAPPNNGMGGACVSDALPSAVQNLLSSKCVSCHGPVPLSGLPSLATYADLTRKATSDTSRTNAEVALARLQNAASPMPPAPGTQATAGEVAALSQFITDNYPKANCATGGGGAGSGGASAADPLSAAPTCTSNSRWTQGNEGSAAMNPGQACINCHKVSGGEGPSFSIAGTLYPTGHEPDLCKSAIGSAGATVEIVGADGQKFTLTPNSAGNFSLKAAVKTPYQAKVSYQGRERLMLSPQTSGDCNACHTPNGANGAPGRVTVP